MFDIAGGELLIIGIVALIVIGPKELPGMLKTAGNAMSKLRRMAGEFRGQFDEAMREAELDEAKKAFTDLNDSARSATTGGFNPLDTIRNEIKAVKEDMKGSSGQTPSAPSAAAPLPMPEPVVQLPPPQEPLQIAPPVAFAEPAKSKPRAKVQVKPAAEPKAVAGGDATSKRARKKPAGEKSGTVA